NLISKYPYFNVAHYLLGLKREDENALSYLNLQSSNPVLYHIALAQNKGNYHAFEIKENSSTIPSPIIENSKEKNNEIIEELTLETITQDYYKDEEISNELPEEFLT